MKNFSKKTPVKLSTNFTSTEFDCHGNGCCSETLIDEKLVEYLQKIRNHFGSPITISSAYRCTKHNKAIGGASKSKHTHGQAADIIVKNVPPAEVAKYAESIGVLGIGLYEGNDGNFVHIDTRTSKAFWYGHGQAYRSTFGGSNDNVATESTTLLKRGDSGAAVRDLQEKLIALKYTCGGAGVDGHFGLATEEAVRKFQRDNNLIMDGIVGSKTLEVLNKKSQSSKIEVTASVLNVRSGSGVNYPVITTIRKGSVHELSTEKGGWGKLKNLAGWVSLDYCKKL